MRIAVLASASHPIRRPYAGGLEALTHQLSLELRRRGHDVVLFASGDSDPTLGVTPIVPRARALRLSDAARRDVSMVAEPFLEEHHAYLGAMLGIADDPTFDVVHNHSLHYLPIAMAPSLPSPLLTTLHTPPTPWLESAMATLPATATGVRFASVSWANARTWSRPSQVAHVVPNGIPLERWPFADAPGEHVVWVGRLVPEKAPHLAIEAARRAGVPLVLAGPVGDEDYVAAQVTPLLGDGVRYVGHLDTGDLAALVGSARACLVTPVWEEPFGLVVTEALACGTPVVGFARGALPELVDPSCGVLVAPDDTAALAEALHAVRQVERRACRERAERDGSITTMTDRYEAIYAEMVA